MSRFLLLFFLFLATQSKAQLSLPDFQVTELTESKVRIYWKNSFANCTQITIQKSYDSLKHFRTIFSSLSPELPENAYVDNDYLAKLKIYYRILYVIDNANYFFTISKIPAKIDNSRKQMIITKSFDPKKFNRLIKINKSLILQNDSNNITITEIPFKEFETKKNETPKIHLFDSVKVSPLPIKKLFLIYYREADSLYKILDEQNFSKFRDSIIAKTKDTLFAYENDIIVWKRFIPDPVWQASEFVYTATQGYVVIQTPLYKKYKYKLIIYDDDNKEAVRIKHIKSDFLMLEKSNFIKAGWYSFELFEDDKLKEKNKFQLIAEF